MNYSKHQPLDYFSDTIEAFLGYNNNLRVQNNEFKNMRNMTGDYYPVITTRSKRGIVKTLENPQGLICRDALCYVDGPDFYINEKKVEGLILSTLAEECPKQLVSMGSYVCIFPDKKYVNTENLSDYGSMEAEFELGSNSEVTYTPCKSDGTAISPKTQETAPESPKNGDYWLDTSGDTHVLKVWSATTNMWVSVATSYIKIAAGGIGDAFENEDCVNITNSGVTDINGYYVIEKKSTDYIIVAGLIDKVTTVKGGLKVERRVPLMDFVVECNNRLWGCHYGPTEDGIVNELYACKLGDFKNWRYYQGSSIDSYAVSLGTDGVFTGAIASQNTPIFFKENYIHHVYGSLPETFSVTTIPCNGVQRGSHLSVCVVDGDILYKGNNGIYAYNGQLPGMVSKVLGNKKYHTAVAGVLNGKYYISMKDEKGKSHLFVYNSRTDIWHHEDETEVKFFEKVDDELYFVDSSNKLITVFCSKGATENDFEWMLETGEYGYSYPNKKYINSITVRFKMGIDAYVNVFIQYDSAENWKNLGTYNGNGKIQCEKLSISPSRCDHFKLKFVGKGDCEIYAITKDLNQGSDK